MLEDVSAVGKNKGEKGSMGKCTILNRERIFFIK